MPRTRQVSLSNRVFRRQQNDSSHLFSSLHPQLPCLPYSACRALDLGCGECPIFSQLHFAQQEFGADIIPYKLAVPFVLCEGSILPFASESFDLVVARVALPYMHIPTAVREIRRVLTPKGSLWATLHLPRMAMKRIKKAIPARDAGDVVHQSYALLNCWLLALFNVQIPWIDGRFESVQTPAGIRRSLKKNGFVDIETEVCPDENGGLHFAASGQKPD